MRNSLSTRGRWWVAAVAVVIVLLVGLAACGGQFPAITPEAPAADVATDTPTEEAGEEEATVEASTGVTSTERVEATEEVSATEEATTTDSDGSASVAVGSEESAATEAAPVDALTLTGGAAIPGDETYKGLPVGFTEDGFLYRGEPDAPIVMIEYSDFACPFCNRHFVQTEPAVDESYVRTGQVRVVFHDFPLDSLHPNAPAAHEASLCVANQESAEKYWNYHAALFRSVEEWQGLSDPLPVFARLAEEVGVDTALYEACMTSREMESVVQERVEEAFARGFSATPSFQLVRAEDATIFPLIGAQPYEQFAAIVDSALAGEMPVAEAPEQSQEEGIPFWATAEGWQPDPDRPGFNMAGDEYRGDLDAPLTVIEFSDFQCPFCQRHNSETQPALDEKYVDTGKVLWVYKHFPLNIHPQAPAAGVAAECAAEQGKFWEMHTALFSTVETWSVENPNDALKSVAEQAGLDPEAFATCLDDPAMLERVNSDLAEGQQFVQGTPTFIIVHGTQGSIIPGALPEATFSEVLDEQLAEAGVTE